MKILELILVIYEEALRARARGVEEGGPEKAKQRKLPRRNVRRCSSSKLTSEKPKIREQTTNTNTDTCQVAITKHDACNFVSHNMTVAV